MDRRSAGLGSLVVAGICLLFAVPLAVKALAEAVEVADLGERGLHADATVIGVEDRSRLAPPLNVVVEGTKVTVSFTDARGRPVRATYLAQYASEPVQAGGTVPVVYDPDDPTTVRREERYPYAVAVIGGLGAVVLLGMCAGSLRAAIRRRRRPAATSADAR
jgi:Protein of unknown function (DUF3592)